MTSTIKIKDLEIYAKHGVFLEEQKNGQPFLVNAEIIIERKSNSDTLSSTLDYGAVCEDIACLMTKKSYQLIESVADMLCLKLIEKYEIIQEITIEVKKPQAPIKMKLGYVSVIARRQRTIAFIGLGSNLGEREKNIKSALDILNARDDTKILATAPFIETKPYGKVDQPDFINTVSKIVTVLHPQELHTVLCDLEKKAGREKKEKWGARTLDMDILFFGNMILDTQTLTIPHYDLHNRLFVLEPLFSLAPNFVHPSFNLPVFSLLAALKK